MRPAFAKFISTVAACAAFAVPAAAQNFTGSEAPYASVKGWDVLSLKDSAGSFVSCGAVKTENGNRVMLAQGADWSWIVATPTNQYGTFGGGVLEIDKVSIDSQFGFTGGFAHRDLSGSELQAIKKGRQMGIAINGDGGTRWWSLSGSTAATLKVTECVQRKGQVAAYQPSPSPSPAPSAHGARLLSNPIPVGQTRVGDCHSVFSSGYRCNLIGQPPKSGYSASVRVQDISNQQPTLDLDVVSASEADVWALMNNNWAFMGRWVRDAAMGDCLAPGPNQSPDARRNLGQDAWQICLR